MQFNPQTLVAGKAPKGTKSGRTLEPAFIALASTLGTEDLRFVSHVEGDTVWFVGAREREFAGTGRLTTKLATALSRPEGDAAYLDDSAATPALLAFRAGEVYARTGTVEQLTVYAQSLGLRVVLLDGAPDTEWLTEDALNIRQARRTVRAWLWTGVAGFAVFGLATAVLVFAMALWAQRGQDATTEATAIVSRTGELLRDSNTNPLAASLWRVGQVQAFAQASGAHLEYLRVSDKGQMSFLMTASPGTDTAPLKALFGKDLVTQDGDNALLIRLGAK